MDNSVSCSKVLGPSGKHGFSFGGGMNSMSLAALSLLAANLPEITDESSPVVYPVATLAPDFAISLSLAGVSKIDLLPLDHPCSPVSDANGITLEEVGHLLEVPGDGADLQEVDNLIPLPDDSLFDLFHANDNETFQNGFNMLEAGLKHITRKTQYGCMPSQENNLLFAHTHAHDWV
jgi:hypothetical protein